MKRLHTRIWQRPKWPNFTWDSFVLLPVVAQARLEQGKLLSRVGGLGVELRQEASINILVEEAVKTAEIEGELLNRNQVRSSIAKHLGLPTFGLPKSTRSIDGLVDVLFDATTKYQAPLVDATVEAWQAALFPTGYFGRERVHFEAVPSAHVNKEMEQFFQWWDSSLHRIDGLIRSGIVHFYFVTIHPFDDGNGLLARALTDRALAQDEKSPHRFYSLSSQIVKEREDYYEVLERCQRGDLDITEWLVWFLECYARAITGTASLITEVLAKSQV